ncbi:unnamed protein product [Meloidogyne enterolobii]
MGKQLEEYSNTDTNTQFKYTHADRALSESIKEQIGETGDKVKDIMKDKVDDNEWVISDVRCRSELIL